LQPSGIGARDFVSILLRPFWLCLLFVSCSLSSGQDARISPSSRIKEFFSSVFLQKLREFGAQFPRLGVDISNNCFGFHHLVLISIWSSFRSLQPFLSSSCLCWFGLFFCSSCSPWFGHSRLFIHRFGTSITTIFFLILGILHDPARVVFTSCRL